MWFHNRVPGPDRLSLCCTLLYDVRVRILYIPVIHFCCLCCAMCCYPAVAAAPVLLLAAAVRHRVPSNTICCCGLLHLIPVFYFSSSKHDLFLMYTLAVLSHVQPRFISIIHGIHPRQIRECAEPRRASARRGEAPRVCMYIIYSEYIYIYIFVCALLLCTSIFCRHQISPQTLYQVLRSIL